MDYMLYDVGAYPEPAKKDKNNNKGGSNNVCVYWGVRFWLAGVGDVDPLKVQSARSAP